MTQLATPTRPRSAPKTRARVHAASPRVVDAVGNVWTHPNPLHLYRWVEHRNDLLKTLGVVASKSTHFH